MQSLDTVLARLGLGDGARSVYRSLLQDGRATPRLLAQRTGITRPSVYDQLKLLMEHDLVVELDIDGKATFAVSDVRHIDALLEDRIEELDASRQFFAAALPKLLSAADVVQPKIRFFEGREGVTRMLKDILWYDDITLSIVWPYHEMREVLGDDFLTWFNERRRARGIRLKTIWPYALRTATQHLFADDGPDVERRFANKDQVAPMGYLIYGSKVAFVSSRAEGFGFIVESAEFSALMTLQFGNLWQLLGKKTARKKK